MNPMHTETGKTIPFYLLHTGQVKRRRNKSPNLLTSPSFMGECSFFMKVSVHFSWVDDSNKLFGAMLDCNQLTNIQLVENAMSFRPEAIANGLFLLAQRLHKSVLKTRKICQLTCTLLGIKSHFTVFSPHPQQLSSQGDITYPLDLYPRESCCLCWGVCLAFWTLLLVEMGSTPKGDKFQLQTLGFHSQATSI